MEWKPVVAGSFFYIEAGTVHAIGGGITVIEVQQNNDVTYRLYDYGRPRELHLVDGVTVSKAAPYKLPEQRIPLGSRQRLLDGRSSPFALRIDRWTRGQSITLGVGLHWFIPINGHGEIDGQPWQGSQCWLVEKEAELSVTADSDVLIATIL